VAAVLRRHPEIQRARLVVVREGASDAMTLACEVAAPVEGLSAAIAATLREACKLGGAVDLVAPDSLPKDGKVIDDQRSYDS
jgi:phenylacetate-CoA ligase